MTKFFGEKMHIFHERYENMYNREENRWKIAAEVGM